MSPAAAAIGVQHRHSIRHRLLLLALLPLGLVLLLTLVALVGWGGTYFERLLMTKVRSDLAVAEGYFDRVRETVGRSVNSLADSERLARALRQPPANRAAALSLVLQAARRQPGQQGPQALDFLRFYDLPAARREAVQWPAIASALAGQPRIANELFSSAQLAALDPALPERARIRIIPTHNAAPDARYEESRGLVLHAAAPVHDEQGRLLGVLSGGVLLNRNLELIDRLNAIVYPDGALPFDSIGTATLFLGDVRIATNVRLFNDDTRAIGTRVSARVGEAVLQRGQTWLARAFVVSHWYISAYQPLEDSRGERIGMLYVGFLEEPLVAIRERAIVTIASIFGVVMALAGIFAVFWARRIFRPIERMHATMDAIEQGHNEARVGPVDSADELGIVARHFDRLLDRLQGQADSLKRWGGALDAKVAERTAELQQAVADLKAAQSQMVMSEKLAAIGQLTAGVAHEINNPIAVIQGNLDVLRDVLGPAATPVEAETRLIEEQVHRIRLIVAKLLQFARPQEFVGYIEPVTVPQLVQDSLLLVGHLLKKSRVEVVQELHSSRRVNCNRNELQQVLINLLVNAIQVLPEDGRLTLASEDWDESDMPIGLRLSVSDNGPGIPPEVLPHLFEPFFTTRQEDGHGLGLWVSRSLIERYGGHLTATSTPGHGATFTIWLRCEPLI